MLVELSFASSVKDRRHVVILVNEYCNICVVYIWVHNDVIDIL